MRKARLTSRVVGSADSAARPFARRAPSRRGIVCVVAMLFLVLFVVLAVGFYAAMTIAAQLAANERAAATSQLAAESGMDYMRYQMGCLDIPATKPADKIFEEVSTQLKARMLNSGNLAKRGIGYDGKSIAIPSDSTAYVQLTPAGCGFRAVLTDAGNGVIRVKVIGSPGSAPSSLARAVELDYVAAFNPTPVFDYGVASAGKVQVKNAAATKVLGTPSSSASILSTSASTPSIATGGGPVGGDLGVMSGKSQVSLGSGSVGGGTTSVDILASHVRVLSTAPEFPWVDTTVFKKYAINTYAAGASYQKNIRVPAGANPTFNGGDVIDGILYIESPNTVTFRGNATINGVIVFENAAASSSTSNVLDFRGNVSPAKIPAGAEFDGLRDLAKGLAIAAPTASLTMSGSVDGEIAGSVIAARIDLAGSADLTLRQGSVIALNTDAMLVEGKTITFVGNASDNPPYAGVRLRSWFKPVPSTYREVHQ
jgi:hypothetical protein